MIDVVNSAGGTGGNAAVFRAAAAAPAANVTDDGAAVAQVAAAPISPRLTFDPISGAMVTEFTGKDGQITAQVPSTAALAYLRAGLNAQGLREVDPNAQAQAKAGQPAAAAIA